MKILGIPKNTNRLLVFQNSYPIKGFAPGILSAHIEGGLKCKEMKHLSIKTSSLISGIVMGYKG
jgi:hypothetical protein